ncbi:MAG: TIR domain-containing protein [Nevskia sp.]|nr:TIR domain-containing protein [Nevskia sp.]
MTGSNYKYPGFISYSHRDRKIAEWLHRALESYRVPKHLIGSPGQHGPVPARLYPIFRDREELSAGALAEQLRLAIAQSRCYILICSPHAATSRWVNEEVEHFLKVRDPAGLLCLIVDGEPNATAKGAPERECFPPALRNAKVNGLPLEPMAAQLDDDADGRDNARLKIIAGLLGVGFDELKRRDLIARNRRLAVLAGLSLGIAAVTVALAFFAVLAQREAEHSRQQGEELIGFMLGDLRAKLEPLGKLDILDAVGDRATAYFAGLDRGSDPGPRALAARAKALRQIGEVRFAQGRPADAVETLSAALKLQRDLVAAAPDDNALLFELGQTEFWVGYAAWRAGQFDQAEANLIAYQEISQRLVARDPANRSWQIEVAYALNNLAILASERKRNDQALPLFQQVVTLSRSLLKDGPLDAETTSSLLGALSWEGSTLISLGRHDEGLARLGEYAEVLRELIRQQPDDRRQQSKLASALSALGYAAIDAGQPKTALEAAREGTALSEPLVLSDPGNLDYRLCAALHLQIDAIAQFQLRHWSEALASNQRASAEFLAVLGQDRSLVKAHYALLASRYLAYELAWQTGDLKAAHAVAAESVKEVSGVFPDDADARVQSLQGHLFALELARYVDHDDAATAAQSDAIQSAFDSITADAAKDSGRNQMRLRAIFDLIRGADHIPDAARPDNASPTAYSVIRFIERHCRANPAQLPAAVCRAEASRNTARP